MMACNRIFSVLLFCGQKELQQFGANFLRFSKSSDHEILYIELYPV